MHQNIWINVGSGGFILNTFLSIQNSSALSSNALHLFNKYLQGLQLYYILMINFSTYMSLEVPEFSPSFSHHRPPPMQYTLLWLLPGTL